MKEKSMSLSPKAKAAADKIKNFDEDDMHSLSETIKHEVQHATEVLTDRAKKAEARIRQFTDLAGDDLVKVRDRTTQTINDHPVPSSLVALGIGFMLGVLLVGSSKR